jgi:uncharacterized protein YhbP (UPF0306 family)
MERDVGIGAAIGAGIDAAKGALVELLAVSTLTLATTGHNGHPHAAPVYFAAEAEIGEDNLPLKQGALRLYFFSDPLSQHAEDLAADPRAAAAVYPPCFDWQDIRGLQMRGLASKVTDEAQWERGWALYQAKFPFVSTLKEVVARSTLYVLLPSWIRLVDNRQGFGFKQEWELR